MCWVNWHPYNGLKGNSWVPIWKDIGKIWQYVAYHELGNPWSDRNPECPMRKPVLVCFWSQVAIWVLPSMVVPPKLTRQVLIITFSRKTPMGKTSWVNPHKSTIFRDFPSFFYTSKPSHFHLGETTPHFAWKKKNKCSFRDPIQQPPFFSQTFLGHPTSRKQFHTLRVQPWRVGKKLIGRWLGPWDPNGK